MNAKPPLVYVVDDDDSFRKAITRLLETAGFRVEGYASAGEFLLADIPSDPACLLLDVHMPGPSGLDLQEALVRKNLSMPVVFLTGYGDIPMSVRAIRSGATDFLTKPVERETLLDAVHRAIEQAERESSAMDRRREMKRRFDKLTARERAVFWKLISGKLNKQIGAELNISERTVKAHRSQVMIKMEATSFADLIRMSFDLTVEDIPED